MFVAFMSLHKSFVPMCALIFYFANRSHSKFHLDLNSNEFAIYKKDLKIKKFSYCKLGMGRNLVLSPRQPSRLPHLFIFSAWPRLSPSQPRVQPSGSPTALSGL
jgi:hypothetical protein